MKKIIPIAFIVLPICMLAIMLCITLSLPIAAGVFCMLCAIALVPFIAEQIRTKSPSMGIFISLALIFVFLGATFFGWVPLFTIEL